MNPEEVFAVNSPPSATGLPDAEKVFLLRLARQALAATIAGGQPPLAPEPCLSERLREVGCCFVTLRLAGRLRGCIGNLLPNQALYRAIMENAAGAGLRDWRFAPLSAAELEAVCIEVSLLSPEQLLWYKSPEELLEQLRPQVHGVVLRLGEKAGTFLPQVWEQFPDKRVFLAELCRKARCEPGDWKDPAASIAVYTVECFSEAENAG